MNIHELDSYNLGDAVKFHRRLNPRLWGRDEHLLPEVREKLLAIAEDFQEFLGVEDLDVQDITLSGSNAAYSYTKNSDIDLHLVVNMPDNPVYQELFNAKKYQYNDEHNIKIGGADVELYVQPADQAHHSQGIYSVQDSEWRQVPQRKRAQVDDAGVRDKVADLDARIHSAVQSKNIQAIGTLWDKIKAMRKIGLEQHGEFGCENISFKLLRNSGCIKLLKDAMTAAQDRELSLREAEPCQRFRYGFSEGMQSQPYSTSDGVAASTKQFLEDSTDDNIVQDFIQHVTTELGIDPMPEIHLHTDPAWSEQNHSFGRYDPDSHTLNVSMPNRHVMDVLRTVAHELVHCSQNQQHGQLPDDAGETGSDWENDANARAGVIMRDWANSHPEHFAQDALEEGASGYIPKNKKEAAMPQYAMALSPDIKPGQTGKEANKLALQTGRNGEPGLLMKTVNLREYKMPQPSQGPGRYRELNEPLGPETPPKMPSGTVKVDVSDTQDWYQLGQDISNLDIANKAHYNQGPPHTVLAFGSEDLEHMYIRQLKKLGLNTHDLDEPGEEDIDEAVTSGPNAAGIILYAEDTGRYGLQQRSETVGDPGVWAAWGGGRDPGESLEQCARRELAEEGGYAGPIELEHLGENPQYVTFLGSVPHEFEPRANSEWQDYCWVEAGDWPTPLHPGTAAALQNISLDENFADGKNPGRKGLSKRVGVNTKASVSDLRKTAKNSSGEKQRMAHWLANMKAGRAKAKRK